MDPAPGERVVLDEIQRLLRELGVPEGPLDADAPIASRLDSLALLSLVVALEDRFRVRLTDDDAATARTLREVARLVAARTSGERIEALEGSP
jgi:acyl carrier protein